MANRLGDFAGLSAWRVGSVQTQSRQTFALNTAYTHGTSANNSVWWRFIAPRSGTLDAIYFHTTALTGTAANISVLCELRSAASFTVPGNTLHASQTASVTNGTGVWNEVVFSTPFTMTRGVTYFVGIGNAAAAPTTDYPTILTAGGMGVWEGTTKFITCRTSTDSDSSTSNVADNPPVVLKITESSTAYYYGNPYTTVANYTSNTLERGMKLTLDASMKLHYVGYGASSNVNALKIYSGTNNPGGTTVISESPNSTSNTGSAHFPAETTLSASTVYRVVLGFSGNSTSPTYYLIEDYARYSAIASARLMGGAVISTISDGGGSPVWTDEADKLPLMILQFSEQVAASSNVIIIED